MQKVKPKSKLVHALTNKVASHFSVSMSDSLPYTVNACLKCVSNYINPTQYSILILALPCYICLNIEVTVYGSITPHISTPCFLFSYNSSMPYPKDYIHVAIMAQPVKCPTTYMYTHLHVLQCNLLQPTQSVSANIWPIK